MSVMASRPVLRWAVPAGVILAVLGGGVLATTLSASADTRLPARSAAQLLVDLQTARLDGASGTVVERADLGLPALTGLLGGAGGDLQLESLLSGSHTLKVWYSGQDKARVALIAALGEQDIVHNGADTWLWNSRDNTATHYKQTAGDKTGNTPKATPSMLPSDLPKTPQEVADQVLAALDPTTAVSIDSNAMVAGRAAYSLVLKPKDTASLVSFVRISIDGGAHIPTNAEIFAKGYPERAAFEVGFKQISFARPDDGRFAFKPPPGAKVTEADHDPTAADPGKAPAVKDPSGQAATPTADKSAVIGTGWTSVLVTRQSPSTATPKGSAPQNDQALGAIQGFLGKLPQVHGAFGSGRVLTSRLLTVLVLDDGRVLVGAVNQDRLMAAAGDPAAQLK